jgi:hypothetical protein
LWVIDKRDLGVAKKLLNEKQPRQGNRFMRAYILIFILTSISTAHAAGLPDTGQDKCYAGAGMPLVACSQINTGETSDYPGQDGRYGRDAAATLGQLPKIGAGELGRDYTKVCNSGELAGSGACPGDPVLGSGNNEWACTQDNVTGLMWEVKTDDGGLRDRDWKYSWYNTDTSTNGGHAGSPDDDNFCFDLLRCDTQKYQSDINTIIPLCGHTEWRVPGKRELLTITNLNGNTVLDYFPNTQDSQYWSASSYVVAPVSSAWVVDIFSASTTVARKSASTYLRLVRGVRF